MLDVLFNIAGVILFFWLIAKLVKNLVEGIGGFRDGIKSGLSGNDTGMGLIGGVFEAEHPERANELQQKYGQLGIDEILFLNEITRTEKEYLVRKVHGHSHEEARELYDNYEQRIKKAKLRLAKHKIARKADEVFDTMPRADKREPISEDVRMFVWRRDGGKCVKCGSQENLHFDHIIPHSKGGSDTERNLQLLCEKCNLEKSDKI